MEFIVSSIVALALSGMPGTTNPEQFLSISGQVTGNSAQQFINQVDKVLQQPELPESVFILINSPGGSVFEGRAMISMIEILKARGVTVNCGVAKLSASMGMHLLTACDNRYALRGAFLLFHEARIFIMAAMAPSDLELTAEQIKLLIKDLEDDLIDELGTTRDVFDKHNIAETLWTGIAFDQQFPDYLEIVDYFILPKDINIMK